RREVARPQRRGRFPKRPPPQRDSASATPAASPASPPPITITLFKNILFRVTPETRLGDEHHFFSFRKPHALAEDREIERLDASEQRAVGVYKKPQRATTVFI